MASFGETLRRERELRGVDLRDIAEATNISLRFLQALEQDRTEVLPGGIFPKAFVRQYATYLGLDPDRLVAEYVYTHGGGPSAAGATPQRPPSGRLAAVFVGLILVAGVALFASARAGLFARRSGEAAPPPAASPDVTMPSDRVYPPPAPSTMAAAPGAPITGALALTLTARQDCWVEVRVDGTVALSRLLTQGETERLEAQSQIVLSVGNAGGIEFAINDRPGIPLGRDGEVKRNIVIDRESVASLIQQGSGATMPAPATAASPRPAPAPSAPARPAPARSTPTTPAPSLPAPSASPPAQSAPAPAPTPSPV
jgi:transcriptional regulator with XRE-family HTH domain